MAQTETVLVVGSWPAVLPSLDRLPVERAQLTVQRTRIRFTVPGVHAVERAVAHLQSAWLLLSSGLDDDAVTALTAAGRTVNPALRTALLGEPHDVERCLRWTRRDCSVYLADSASPERVVQCVRLSCGFQLVVIDDCFAEAACAAR